MHQTFRLAQALFILALGVAGSRAWGGEAKPGDLVAE